CGIPFRNAPSHATLVGCECSDFLPYSLGTEKAKMTAYKDCCSAHLGACAAASFCAIFNILVHERRPADCRAIKCSRQGSWLGAVLFPDHAYSDSFCGTRRSAFQKAGPSADRFRI